VFPYVELEIHRFLHVTARLPRRRPSGCGMTRGRRTKPTSIMHL